MKIKKIQIIILMAICFTFSLGVSSNAKAAVKTVTVTGRQNIGGNEGYTISINSTFSVNSIRTRSTYQTFAAVRSIHYDVSRNRRYTKKVSPITIEKVKITYGASGFTEDRKRQSKSCYNTYRSRSGNVKAPSSWKRVNVEDSIGVTGANITVYYKEKGKSKRVTVLANFEGAGMTDWGRTSWGR